jgi:hypothetical protein
MTIEMRNAGEAVLVTSRSVPLGHVFQADDITVVHVTVKEGTLGSIGAADQDSVIGHTAAVPFVPGELLVKRAIGPAIAVPVGDAVVGISLKSGQYPIGLTAGEQVWVVNTGSVQPTQGVTGSAGPIQATVLASETLADDPLHTTVFSLLVRDTDAAQVTGMSAAGRTSLALVPPSTP